jgi:heme/copper-type cytochrome/quinol oxidase subunit 2
MNTTTLVIVVIISLIVVGLLIYKNKKDRKDLEQQLNKDVPLKNKENEIEDDKI